MSRKSEMTRIFGTLLVILITVVPAPAQTGQGQADSEVFLTLPDAIELSYRRNPLMEAQRLATEAAGDQKKATWGLRLPHLSASGAYTYMSKDIEVFDLNAEKNAALQKLGQLQLPITIPTEIIQAIQNLDLSLTLQKQQFAVVGVNATMPIYMGGKINAAVNASKINIQQKEQAAVLAQTDLFAETVERYYGLSLSYRVTQVKEQVTEAMRKHLYDAQKLEENGQIARTEKLYAEMFLAKAEGEETKSKLETRTINQSLSATLNQPGEYIPVTALFVVDSLPPLSYFKEQTRRNSPLLKQVELTKRLAEVGVKAARANFLPEIAALGVVDAWNYQLTHMAPRWAVGAGVKLRIFDGLGSEYKFSAAKKEVRQVEALKIKADNDLMTLVEKLYNQLKGSAVEVHSLGSSVEFARSYLDAKQKAFREGMAPSSEVVDAQLALSAVTTERLVAAFTFDVTLAQLLALSGETERYTEFQYQPDYQIVTNESVNL